MTRRMEILTGAERIRLDRYLSFLRDEFRATYGLLGYPLHDGMFYTNEHRDLRARAERDSPLDRSAAVFDALDIDYGGDDPPPAASAAGAPAGETVQ